MHRASDPHGTGEACTPAPAAGYGVPYSFTPTATNAESFTITNKPAWATFNTATGAASIKDGITGATSQGYSSFAPAPGAIALVGIAGVASRRRRA